MKKIALSGNIGSGKSYVANLIRSYGICVLDCDKIAAEVRQNHIDEISTMFQMDAQDTKGLADVVFSDDVKREQLEAFLYPLIQKELQNHFLLHSNEKLIIVEVPLVFEKRWESLFDEIWVVACDVETSIRRLMKHRQFQEADIRRRLARQISMEEKIRRADVVLYNVEDQDIEEQVRCLLKKEGVEDVETR